MIGSPDVVALTKEDDFGDGGLADPWVVPEEFSVPLFPQANNANPWAKTSYAKFTKDFILISEFSEQVGPQPLLTIPDDPKVCGTFDLNYFSLRIMSVDYQASFVGHPPGSGYPRLSFVEDSRVVLGDSKEGAFAYVHHLTLYDLEARGFVRPFCMAYVSADERKIMLQFEELSLRFSRASECLKTGNRRAFARELQRKLRDLDYTRSVLQKEEGLQREAGPQGCYSAHVVEKANELAAVEKSIYEHRDLLRQITSYPLRPRRDPHAAHCQHCVMESQRHTDTHTAHTRPGCESGMQGEECDQRRQSYTPQLIKGKSAKCFDKRLKTLTELCEENFYGATVELLTDTERCFRGDLCYLHTHRLDRALRRKLNITNFLFEEEPGEEEEEVAALGRIFCSLTHTTGTDSHTRDPFIVLCPTPLDCVEDLEVNLPCPDGFAQQKEALIGEEKLESSLSDLTMEIQEQESSEENKDSLSSDRSAREEAGGERAHDRGGGGDVEGEKGRDGKQGGREAHSDSSRVGKESSSEDGGSSPGEEDGGEEEDQSPVFLLEEEAVKRKTDRVCEPVEGTEEGSDPDSLVQMDTACCMSQEGFLYDPSTSDMLPGPGCLPLPLVVNQEPQATLSVQGAYGLGSPRCQSPGAGLDLPVASQGDTTSRGSDQDGSDCTMSVSTGSEQTSSSFEYGSVVTLRQRKKAGQGALRFVRQYPFALQALWSLLSGRTLVVLGSEEGRVRRLVSALALYVPGPGRCGERVQPWLSCPFSLTDLQRWKLIGLQRLASPVGTSMLCSLSRYSRYISILDADEKTLRCPGYRGNLLANMANHRTHVRRGSTYFLHLQSMLSSMVARAFLLTFTHHLHLPISPGEKRQGVGERRRGFLMDQLGLTDDDCRIMLYLSQLVTHRYLETETGGAVTTLPCLEANGTSVTMHRDPVSVTIHDPATGGAVSPEENLDTDTGVATTRLDLESARILEPATVVISEQIHDFITPEQYLEATTRGAEIPEQYLDPTTGGAETLEQDLGPDTKGTKTPEKDHGLVTRGCETPEQVLDPAIRGTETPEQNRDTITGGAVTPEQYLDPATTQSATSGKSPPSFTFNYTTSQIFKI
ncbi:hypothetical protein DPEC_G00274620 [Dallia pectoralis]|uniref:Uncharacterized protein n=1 Tax=Dallia pectoralis TaxID=75939 RepID=A0ACC2FL78_DALPE|nr:hypothetical protein DPEC_G00274620 [Dallia pectoralis]